MSRHRRLDPEQIAQINERIRETFEFARDAIEDPAILEDIPDGSEIAIRHVTIDSLIYHIVGFRSESDPGCWVARTTGRSVIDESSDRQPLMLIRLESDVSAKAAIDAVESALRAAAESNLIAHQIA